MTNVFNDPDQGDTFHLAMNSQPKAAWLTFGIAPFFMAKNTNLGGIYVTVSGGLAYVADQSRGLKIIDISNGIKPILIGSLPEFYARGVTVSDDLAYVAVNPGLKIIDISNSSNPILRGSLTGFNSQGLTVSGSLAYLATYDQGLEIIDISNSDHPVQMGKLSGFNAYGVTVKNNLAYVATYDQGLKIIDISNSSSPFLVGPGVPGLNSYGVTVSGNLAYVAADQGLQIIDISNSSHPVPRGHSECYARGVTVSGNLAYVATTREGLEIIDISQPNNPIAVGQVKGEVLYSIALQANKVYAVGNSFCIFDMTNYQFSGTPSNSDAGNYNITVTATDPVGGYASTSFTIRVEGGPRLSPNVTIPPQIAWVGHLVIFFLDRGTFFDPNNDVITYDATLANGKRLPSFLSFNPSSATFSGVSTLWDKGNYTVTIFASDRIVYPATPANFTLVVQDPIADQTFIVGRDNAPPALPIPPDSTFEGRSLVYSLKPRNTEILPDWLHFDAASRKLFGVPNAIDVGTMSMQVTLADGYGKAFCLFNLRVKFNTPPVLASMIPAQSVQAEKHYQFDFGKDTFTDADGDKLRYSANLGGARWLKFDADNRTFTGTASGWTDAYPYFSRQYRITVTATDPSNATATGTFDLNLNGSLWQTFITAGMVILGTLATTYGYAQKKHLLWDFFKKDKYLKPRELLVVGDMEFVHKIGFPAEHIKSIIVTTSRDRSCARKMAPCCKKTLGFFPMLEGAISNIEVRAFQCASVYFFPWLFYDSEENVLKSVKGGPTAEFIGKDIKIQIRGTDNRIMEEFHIKVSSERNEIAEIADEAVRARKTRGRNSVVQLSTAGHKATAELRTPLISPIADISSGSKL